MAITASADHYNSDSRKEPKWKETLPSLADSGSGEPRIAAVLEVILPVVIMS